MRGPLTIALVSALAVLGCANPYCGARGEACCASETDPCAAPLVCYQGTCSSCGAEFEGCCAGACDPGLFCTIGLANNRCARPCDVLANDCPADENCAWSEQDTSGFCTIVGPLGIDARCERIGDCQRGLVCARHAAGVPAFCEVACTSAADCPPTERRAVHDCLPLSPGDARMTCF